MLHVDLHESGRRTMKLETKDAADQLYGHYGEETEVEE
jgi:hypothetical protein